ncbi:uncharacterized protein Triagg1_8285 [Trichoderma aggressivum f. europaeum]|uniref:Uncharacterized protein n=1 Tax=Trichoderma aggressivum f. europaeum TaxID=173218 RepID=A0AAE1IAL5_9HYPO|nr:hypothetical protein Triagg1_8285 [Trichoderma aggressivum f. europaeum]
MNPNVSQLSQSEALNEPLRKFPISASVQEGLLEALWEASGRHGSMSPYFKYYSNRIQRLRLDGCDGFCADSHADIASIARRILDGASRDEIFEQVAVAEKCPSASTTADINHGIDMCASLLVMTEIELNGVSAGLSGLTAVPWKIGSLNNALATYFCPQKTLQADRPKLGKVFTARNLNRIAGIEIRWTTNLADHLRLVDDDQVVFIFHCASFLQLQKSLDNSPFPASFLQETLDTLALLFPSSDNETASWLKSIAKIDPRLLKCGSLRTRERRLENFDYWHDQLVILKQAFDESSPRNISQWWFDRRNGVQWYTFWIAILVFVVTIFFGIVQSVEGALQVYLSYKSMQSG